MRMTFSCVSSFGITQASMTFYLKVTVLFAVLFTFGTEVAFANLSYLDNSISDGSCTYPAAVPIGVEQLLFAIHNGDYYIPVASQMMFRYEFQAQMNRPPQNMSEFQQLSPRVNIGTDLISLIGGITQLRLSDLTLHTFGGQKYYSYQILPSLTFSLGANLNFTATNIPGSDGSAPKGLGGTMTFTVVWTDPNAWLIWGCIQGRQNFHVVSKTSTLSPDQWNSCQNILGGMGFHMDNVVWMNYTSK